MADQKVITLEPHGPAGTGLQRWEDIPAAEVVKGAPVQRGHVYFEDETGSLTAGTWDCTAFEGVPMPYPVHEYMLVLEGSITIVHQDGREDTFRAGDHFVLPKGLPCTWKQTEYARKFFVIFDDPSGQQAADSTSLAAIRLDVDEPLPAVEGQDPARFRSDVPNMGQRQVYIDPTGQFAVGLWECSGMELEPTTIGRSELMHLLDGQVTVTNGDGEAFEYDAGDTFLVPKGMGYHWRHSGDVRKVYCSFTPV